VSTRSQTDDAQLDALTAAGCERIWTDTASGKLARRPEWDKCLDYLRDGDELVVTRLSRMARSVRHLTEIAALLGERGVDLVVLKQGIDTTTPAGRFLFHVIGAMAVHPRTHRRGHPRGPGRRARQRCTSWLAAGHDRRTGPPRRALLAQPENTVSSIARLLGVSRSTIYKYVPELGDHGQPAIVAGQTVALSGD
jgi:DNA invertase Pin-like site-specific DNA recombinase